MAGIMVELSKERMNVLGDEDAWQGLFPTGLSVSSEDMLLPFVAVAPATEAVKLL